MRALRFERYGSADELRIEALPEPRAAAEQVELRVHAVALNPLDYKVRAGHLRFLPGFRGPPRGLGCDFAGEIVATGRPSTAHRIGERVFGSLLPFAREGALAEFLVVDHWRALPIPATLDAAQACALPIAGGAALQALADEAKLLPGQRVLITGAAGGVGHFAVQIAKHLGARVVAVCSASNVDFVRGLGADEVIDYAREDFTRRSDQFDVVFDAAGVSSFAAASPVLSERGCYVDTCGTLAAVARTLASAVRARITSRRRAIPIALRNQPSMWRRLSELARDGILRPHVERTITLEEVAAAQRAMETGHGRGKIVVRPG